MNIWLTILLSTLVVFGSRYFFLEPCLNVPMHRHLKGLLRYSGPAIMTAIWAPIIFVPHGELNSDPFSPLIIGAVAALLIAALTKHVLLTIVVSSLAFFSLSLASA